MQTCIPVVDKPRTKHETMEACLQLAYYKSLELEMMNKQLNPTVQFRCVKEEQQSEVYKNI
jgi:hypothetical protein